MTGRRLPLLAAVLAASVLVLGAVAGASAATPGWTVPGISQELMCPVCKERLDMSDAPAADRIRAFLEQAHRRGLSESEVKHELVASYGDSVLAAPPKHGFGLAAWLVPGVVLVGGAAAAVVLARRWRRARVAAEPAASPPVDDPGRARLERRLDAELERFE